MSPSGVVPLQEQTVTRSLAARTRVLAASAALLLAVGALAGCSDHPGQAADMHYTGLDGARHSVVVSEKDIDVVAKEMASAPAQTGQERLGAKRSEIASSLIEAPILSEVAQAHGLTITDAQIVQLAKEQLGFEPRKATTITYLRAKVMGSQFEKLHQQSQQAQPVFADLRKVYGTLDGDLSPRYPTKRPVWWTQTDPSLESANSPLGGGLQQAPQQQPQQQQQAPQQGGQQPQQQAPQQGGGQQPQQQAPQQGGQQPADSGQTDGQGDTGQADGAAGENGQGADQAETNGQ